MTGIKSHVGTAAEILAQCGGKVDMIVCGAGTGGTVAGIGRKIKEELPSCKVEGVGEEREKDGCFVHHVLAMHIYGTILVQCTKPHHCLFFEGGERERDTDRQTEREREREITSLSY